MINVKDQVYSALQNLTENVGDRFPKDWAKFPAIQYTEEDNSVVEMAGGEETKSHLLYRVDIWSSESTSNTALEVDKALSKLGLVRKQCNDVDDPSGLRHKVMRYEGIIDVETEFVYQR